MAPGLITRSSPGSRTARSWPTGWRCRRASGSRHSVRWPARCPTRCAKCSPPTPYPRCSSTAPPTGLVATRRRKLTVHRGPHGELRGRILSQHDTTEHWRAVNRCGSGPDSETVDRRPRRHLVGPGGGAGPATSLPAASAAPRWQTPDRARRRPHLAGSALRRRPPGRRGDRPHRAEPRRRDGNRPLRPPAPRRAGQAPSVNTLRCASGPMT